MRPWKRDTQRMAQTDESVAVLTALIHEVEKVVDDLRVVTAEQKEVTAAIKAVTADRARRGGNHAD